MSVHMHVCVCVFVCTCMHARVCTTLSEILFTKQDRISAGVAKNQ